MSAVSISSARFGAGLLPWIERLGCVVLLAMPLMMFLGIAICDAAIITIAVLFLLRSSVLRDFSWLHKSWVQFGLVLWVYLLIISPYALMSAKLSFKQALPFGRFVLFAAGLQFWLLRNKSYRHYLLYTLGAALLLISVDLIFTFLTGLSLVGKSSVQYQHLDHITWIWQRHYTRIVGLNGKMNNGTMLAWAAMPFIVCMLLNMHQKQDTLVKKILSAAAVLLISLAVLVTGERMALLELCLGYFLVFVWIKPLRLLLLGIGVLCVAIIFGVMWHSPGLWSRNVTQVIDAVTHIGTNDYGRISKAAMHMFYDHPLFGMGLKQYYLASLLPEYVSFNAVNSHAQNMYLEFLTGTGLCGSVLFLGLLYCWLRQFWDKRKVINASPIAIAVLIAFILRIWPFASTTSFFFAWGAITFWWMGAWLLAIIEEKENG